ncbi:hypothetical protein [Paraferrimonas sedimenticola]|uniref:hypothetical protein n=1 Tax=Paraferrimonas sedimenticola TaxID=375674 RepID=UPI001472871C|nr:hypothetical protein [Paraferrimonas sedimenticola]
MIRLLSALLLLLFHCNSFADGQRITIGIAPGLVDEAGIAQRFSSEGRAHLQFIHYFSEHQRDGLLVSGRLAHYQMFVMDHLMTRLVAELDLLQPLPQQVLANHSFNACGVYGVPLVVNRLGILVNPIEAAPEIVSWRQVFNPPEAYVNRLVLPLHSYDTVSAGLMALGYHPYSKVESQHKALRELFKNTRSSLLANGTPYYQGKGQMNLTIGYPNQLESLKSQSGDDNWQFVAPKEGVVEFYECLVVPKGQQLTPDLSALLRSLPRYVPNNINPPKSTQRYSVSGLNALQIEERVQSLNDLEVLSK